jgi:hypothetical protein
MHRHLRRSVLSVAAIVLVAAACTGDTPGPSRTEPAATTPSRKGASASPTPGSPAPAEVLGFTAPRLGGGTIEGAEFAGRDVAFWFWAPW